jgi:hypothetical protein
MVGYYQVTQVLRAIVAVQIHVSQPSREVPAGLKCESVGVVYLSRARIVQDLSYEEEDTCHMRRRIHVI